MHRTGHYGANLIAYSPIGAVLVALGAVEFAVGGAAIVVAGSMVPDWDQRVPFVTHRGITHTVWFLLAVAGAFGVIGALLGAGAGLVTAIVLGVFGFGVGAAMIGGHLLADALTPMGIAPFEPVRSDHYSLDVVRAANTVANYVLFAVGVLVAGVAFLVGSLVGGLF